MVSGVAVSFSVTQSRVASLKLLDVSVDHLIAIFNWWNANPKWALVILATWSLEGVVAVAISGVISCKCLPVEAFSLVRSGLVNVNVSISAVVAVVKGAEWVMFITILDVDIVRFDTNFISSKNADINCVFSPEVHNNGVVLFIETSTSNGEDLR